jgi:LacI family transcriptional regulator
MTVSRVMNGGSNVREDTKRDVLAAVERLNYRPNVAARSLAAGNAMQIGLIYANPSHSYLSQFLIGALDAARFAGCHLVIEPCADAGPAMAEETVRQFSMANVRGAILPPPLSELAPLLAEFQLAGIPCVTVARGVRGPSGPNVRIADRAAAADLTRHLLDLGHRDIAFIKGHPNQQASAERFAGFASAMAAAGIASEALRTEQGYFTSQSGAEAAERLLASAIRPTAIFAANDDMAAGAVGVAHRHGLDVPGDLSVVGFDDTAIATAIWPELTTIRQPIAEMAAMAVKLLLEQLQGVERDGEGARDEIVLPYELVARASSGHPSLR